MPTDLCVHSLIDEHSLVAISISLIKCIGIIPMENPFKIVSLLFQKLISLKDNAIRVTNSC
jgi:hypothetical protein